MCIQRLVAVLLFALSTLVNHAQSQEDVSEAPPTESSVQVFTYAPAEDDTFVTGDFVAAFPAANGFISLANAEMDPSSMVEWPQIADEIEIVEDQRNQIREVRQAMHAKMQEAAKSFGESQRSGKPVKHQAFAQRMQKIQQEMRSKIQDDILLPHQVDRLRQLDLQMKMRHSGPGGALFSQQLTKELGISDAQKARLQTAAKNAQKYIQEELERVQSEARKQVMAELTDAQRERLGELLGNPVDLSQPRRPRR